jgi:hypothetical protein
MARKKQIKYGRPEKGFRSKFEASLADWFEKNNILYEYEPCKIKYTVPAVVRSYTPDWRIGDTILVESKGMFKYEDMRKMILLQEQHPDTPILLIFQNSKTKIRKGSPTSYGDWATKHNFKWVDAKQLTKDFFKNE